MTTRSVVRCGTCFREEVWSEGGVEVRMAGGHRRPSIPGDLAIWRVMRQVAVGAIPAPVAACEACGQPMFLVEGACEAVPKWSFTLPDVVIEVSADGHVIGGDDHSADQKMEDHYRAAVEARPRAGEVGFAVVLFAVVAALGAVVGACECPNLALAAIGAGVASRHRSR